MRRIKIFILAISIVFTIAFAVNEYVELSKAKYNLELDISIQENVMLLKNNENQKLQNEIKQLIDENGNYKKEIEEVKSYTDYLDSRLQAADEFFDDKRVYVPSNYYFIGDRRGTYDQLVYYLNKMFEMPVDYNLNVFDCSEQAAFMERELENHGFKTDIILGESPNGSGVNHAWIIVYTSDDFAVAIEPTAIMGGMDGQTQKFFASFKSEGRGIVYSNKNSNYYENYDYRVHDIYEAIELASFEEFDWWLGMWKLKQPYYGESSSIGFEVN